MPTAALLMLQVASAIGPTLPDAAGTAGSLAKPVPAKSCVAKANEILVCGKDGDTYRLPKGASQGVEGSLPKAEWKVFGNATAGVGASQRNVGGYTAPAAMVTIKVPF